LAEAVVNERAGTTAVINKSASNLTEVKGIEGAINTSTESHSAKRNEFSRRKEVTQGGKIEQQRGREMVN
jgi:hypothetical protein